MPLHILSLASSWEWGHCETSLFVSITLRERTLNTSLSVPEFITLMHSLSVQIIFLSSVLSLKDFSDYEKNVAVPIVSSELFFEEDSISQYCTCFTLLCHSMLSKKCFKNTLSAWWFGVFKLVVYSTTDEPYSLLKCKVQRCSSGSILPSLTYHRQVLYFLSLPLLCTNLDF